MAKLSNSDFINKSILNACYMQEPTSAVLPEEIKRRNIMLNKKRNFAQKVGHTTRKINNFFYDIQEDRIKRAKKFQKKHEGLVGGFIIACIAAPITLGIAGAISEKVEEKKAQKNQLDKENMTERAEEIANATKASRTQVGDIVIEN